MGRAPLLRYTCQPYGVGAGNSALTSTRCEGGRFSPIPFVLLVVAFIAYLNHVSPDLLAAIRNMAIVEAPELQVRFAHGYLGGANIRHR
jgi:hypothetical protein